MSLGSTFATAVDAAVCYASHVASKRGVSATQDSGGRRTGVSGQRASGPYDSTSVNGASDDDDELPCSMCGSREQGAVMLLCDGPGCATACHTFCLDPPLTTVPAGDWFCPDCRGHSEGNKGEHVSQSEIEQLRQRLRSAQSVNFCRPAELLDLLDAPGGAEWYHAVSRRLDATELTELGSGKSPMDGATLDIILERGAAASSCCKHGTHHLLWSSTDTRCTYHSCHSYQAPP